MTLDQLLSKAFNGKAENIVISKNIIMFHLDGVETRINLVSFIEQIYNDHEAQLKLASDVYSTDKMHMYQELKAKDKQITELNHTVSGLNEMYLEAKEEIERVKEAMQEFVNRCEKGEAVRSRYTYYKFKELLKDKK